MYFLVTTFNFNKADELDLTLCTRINLIRISWICNVYLSCQINQFNGYCRFKVQKYLNRNEYECSKCTFDDYSSYSDISLWFGRR